MKVNHILHLADGDVVKTFQHFLAAWWLKSEWDALLAPVELPNHAGAISTVIDHPGQLEAVNPFAPIMLSNAAAMVGGFVREHPEAHLAVILRPCELRALVELAKRNRFQYQPVSALRGNADLAIIGVDCPGTLSAKENTQRQASPERLACQLCDSPTPMDADVVIGTLGVASQGHLLVIARDEIIDEALSLPAVTDGIAPETLAGDREEYTSQIIDSHHRKLSGLIQDQERSNVSTLASFTRCTLCADCLDACPLYNGELTDMLGVSDTRQAIHPLLSELVNVSRWLASCSGCGMCQEACTQNIPLAQIVTPFRRRIQTELNYWPGKLSSPLPWRV